MSAGAGGILGRSQRGPDPFGVLRNTSSKVQVQPGLLCSGHFLRSSWGLAGAWEPVQVSPSLP